MPEFEFQGMSALRTQTQRDQLRNLVDQCITATFRGGYLKETPGLVRILREDIDASKLVLVTTGNKVDRRKIVGFIALDHVKRDLKYRAPPGLAEDLVGRRKIRKQHIEVFAYVSSRLPKKQRDGLYSRMWYRARRDAIEMKAEKGIMGPVLFGLMTPKIRELFEREMKKLHVEVEYSKAKGFFAVGERARMGLRIHEGAIPFGVMPAPVLKHRRRK